MSWAMTCILGYTLSSVDRLITVRLCLQLHRCLQPGRTGRAPAVATVLDIGGSYMLRLSLLRARDRLRQEMQQEYSVRPISAACLASHSVRLLLTFSRCRSNELTKNVSSPDEASFFPDSLPSSPGKWSWCGCDYARVRSVSCAWTLQTLL